MTPARDPHAHLGHGADDLPVARVDAPAAPALPLEPIARQVLARLRQEQARAAQHDERELL